MQYVALLRGINVGGNNLIKMAALKACFESKGFDEVATYIQSGNVLFTAPGSKSDALAARIEQLLVETFHYPASLVLLTQKQMLDIVERAPPRFGKLPSQYRYDVIFLKRPLTSSDALKKVPTNPVVDAAHAGPGVLYFSRLTAKASQSRLSRIISMPIYKSMTIRNWNTTTKLLHMMNEREK